MARRVHTPAAGPAVDGDGPTAGLLPAEADAPALRNGYRFPDIDSLRSWIRNPKTNPESYGGTAVAFPDTITDPHAGCTLADADSDAGTHPFIDRHPA